MSNEKQIKMEQQYTPLGKSYWGNKGAYQKQYDELEKKLIPSQGEADTVHGEMLRAIGNLFYDYCNNGNGNAVDQNHDDCPECNGTGWEQEEEYVDDDENGNPIYEEVDVDCGYCGGECTIPADKFVTPYYEKQLKFLKDNMTNPETAKALEEFMTDKSTDNSGFSDKEMNVYNKVCDEVVFQALTTENESREVKA